LARDEQQTGDRVSRERIFNLPGVITALISVLVAIELAVDLFPQSLGAGMMAYFSFIPARLSFLIAPNAVFKELADLDVDADELASLLNSAKYAWWTPLTYAFLHANWTHLGVNSLTLAAFGAPVARRLGTARFLVFFAATAIGGAFAHLMTHPFDLGPVVGASAAISGAMGAIVRFAFERGEALGEGRHDGADEIPAPHDTASLKRVFSNQRATFFLLTWLAANVLFGQLPPSPGSAGVIAWEAHIGGFMVGLLLFGWFDRAKGDPPR
jgi:membrane associated rhomboid family serine protease